MLKIKPEHYKLLEAAIAEVLAREENKDIRRRYRDAGLSDTRFHWDVLYACTIEHQSGCAWINKELYPYLHDEHIDSALRRIIK